MSQNSDEKQGTAVATELKNSAGVDHDRSWWDKRERHEQLLREVAVAACVHDRLVDMPYRGPAVPFADKARQLALFVQKWAARLVPHENPNVNRLGRRMLACPPYDPALRLVDMHGRPLGAAGACRSSICPHCYARLVDLAHRSLYPLDSTQYLNAVTLMPPVQNASEIAARKGLRLARNRMLRLCVKPVFPYNVVVATAGQETDGQWKYLLAALVSSPTPEVLKLGKRDRGWVTGRASVPLNPLNLKEVMTTCMPYWHGLTSPSLTWLLPFYHWVVSYDTLIG